MNILRRLLLSHLDLAQDGQCIIDSLPIEVVHFHLVPSCRGDWGAYGATFGKVTTKKQTNRIHLHTLPRRNQKSQLPACVKYLLSAARQLIETVNSQLTEQFNIESSHAHSF